MNALVISKTPYRISFFGGGSDYKTFFERNTGSVLSATFNKYCYVTVRKMPPFFNYKNQLTYSEIERFNEPDEVEHPLVRETLKYLGINGLQISYDADLPARSGIGSSSSFAVGLLNSIYSLIGKAPDKYKLAKQAIHIERDLCAEAGGWQDQIAVAVGGLNRIDFSSTGFDVYPLGLPQERINALNERLVLYFSGFQRFSNELALKQEQKISDNTAVLREMSSLSYEGEKILRSGKLEDFGRLLDHGWKLKSSLSGGISNDSVDECYARALKAGALGGKLLGAGGGGFVLLYVEPENREKLKQALSGMLRVPFRFENDGTTIIHKGDSESE